MTTNPVRRVVTGHNESNQSIIVSDGPPARIFDNLGASGLVLQEIWHTTEMPAVIDRYQAEADEDHLQLAPPSNGVRIRIVDFPPDNDSVDHEAIFENIGGAGAKTDANRHESFHRTETIDYGIVLSGEIVLLVDEGETTVRPGDFVIQRGTNHGWANRTDEMCRVAFILIDGVFDDDVK